MFFFLCLVSYVMVPLTAIGKSHPKSHGHTDKCAYVISYKGAVSKPINQSNSVAIDQSIKDGKCILSRLSFCGISFLKHVPQCTNLSCLLYSTQLIYTTTAHIQSKFISLKEPKQSSKLVLDLLYTFWGILSSETNT